MDDYIKSINHSVSYAWKAEDTLQALNETVHRIGAYNRLGRYEEVVPMFNDVYNLIVNKYGEKAAAPYCILPVNSLLELNELEKAKAYLDTYRWLSGYFDTEGRIEKGRETYYYYKGKYHLASQEYDSAEYSFRKELECGLDFTNQNMASRGLSLLYQQTNRLDSATKYAIYSYEMNDSVYSRMATKEVEQMTAIHNYSHYKKIAQQEKDKARKNRVEKYLITALLIALICVGVITFFIILKRKKAADEQYKKIVRELEKARKELQNLQSMSEETPNLMAIREKFDMQIKEKEMQIQILQSTLAQYHNSEYQTNHQAEDLLYESETFRQLQKKSIGCSALSDADWDEIEELVKEALPGFHFFLTSHSKDFNTVERRTCILLRLHIGMKDAGSLMGVSKSYISRISSEIMKRIFECKGSGKELKKSLEAIC